MEATFWTVCTARTGQFKAVDPQYEQTIEGHKLGSVRMGTTGENDVRSAVATQWPTSMRYEDALNLC